MTILSVEKMVDEWMVVHCDYPHKDLLRKRFIDAIEYGRSYERNRIAKFEGVSPDEWWEE